jgi:hypothetical protein
MSNSRRGCLRPPSEQRAARCVADPGAPLERGLPLPRDVGTLHCTCKRTCTEAPSPCAWLQVGTRRGLWLIILINYRIFTAGLSRSSASHATLWPRAKLRRVANKARARAPVRRAPLMDANSEYSFRKICTLCFLFGGKMCYFTH